MTDRDDETGRFLPGNRFWEARSSHGRNPIFAKPEDLWAAVVEYFEWVEANPLYEEKVFNGKDGIVRATIAKMRAMTISGLCVFLDIARGTWDGYRERPDFMHIVTRAEEIIRDQKFSGAAADLLNANIIARDLGLVDKQDVDQKTKLEAGDSLTELLNTIAQNGKRITDR
ncbi:MULTISPECIES: DNA-packaging protein [unclassified Shinella]|uniref:DNA-packaging protein n=1 Tax=unclassified Shinella TaxID=2643062 RepID=UPI00225CA023|nr:MULTISPECIES: DNA-packaging protein [unclassified Shinella]MCO5140871.1 DNA-packaging protein [Shinella sp.]MDC7256438.1 DNA-packaging protein [Shinella sp. YE25]CAI0339305.1 conserved hypothetical protein [Rhizobiaceae bacterium]CAK7257714.1 DNA-packaging protein [Shinella sp. WSC3-e]